MNNEKIINAVGGLVAAFILVLLASLIFASLTGQVDLSNW